MQSNDFACLIHMVCVIMNGICNGLPHHESHGKLRLPENYAVIPGDARYRMNKHAVKWLRT